MVFDVIVQIASDIIQTSGYTGIFVLMVLESMIFPVPSEAVMPFAGFLSVGGTFNLYLVTLVSGAASVTGSLLSYAIGRYGGRPFLNKYGKYFLVTKKDLDWSHRFFHKYGKWAILVGRFIPVIRHVISIPAGVAKMHLWPFIWTTFVGATTWNFILAYLGFKSVGYIGILSKYSRILDGIVLIILALAAVWFVNRHFRKQ